MKRHQVFQGKYAKAADLPPEGQDFTISRVAIEEIGLDREKKLIVYFHETPKALVTNVTNFDAIAALLGDDTDDWIDGRIGLYAPPITFRGVTKPAIRVRPAKPVKATASRATSSPAPSEVDDDVFFADEDDESAAG